MLTKELFQEHLSKMTELEVADLCDVLYEHIEKERMGHLCDKFCPWAADEINELEEKIESLKNEVNESDEELAEYKKRVTKVIVGLNGFVDSVKNVEYNIERLKSL